MQIGNAWGSLMGAIVGAVFLIAFWGPFNEFANLATGEAEIFIKVIFIVTTTLIGAIIPVAQATQDDRGHTS